MVIRTVLPASTPTKKSAREAQEVSFTSEDFSDRVQISPGDHEQ